MSLNFKVAVSDGTQELFNIKRVLIPINDTNFTDIAVAIISMDDAKKGFLEVIKQTDFDSPIFLVILQDEKAAPELLPEIRRFLMQVSGIFERNIKDNADFYDNKLKTAAKSYEDKVLTYCLVLLQNYKVFI